MLGRIAVMLARGAREHAPVALAFLAFLSLLLGGCDSGSNPSDDLFSSLWPNGDGSSWTFRYVLREGYLGGATPPTEDDHTDWAMARNRSDLEANLARLASGSIMAAATDSGTLELVFDGTVMTGDGPKQNLRGTVSETGKSGSLPGDPLLARIYLARPDLRRAMSELGLVSPAMQKNADFSTSGPLFSSGGNFEKQQDWMGYYPDAELGPDSSYTIVREPLTPGASFRHQLVPQLADDIWEYGWIDGWTDFTTTAGAFHALEIIYLVDFGESMILDEQGDTLGSYSPFAVANAFFAPGVGPIYERGYDALGPSISELGIDRTFRFYEMRLAVYDIR